MKQQTSLPSSCPDLVANAIHVWRISHTRSNGRAQLLRLLGFYLGVPSTALHLATGEHGRPSLPPPHDRLNFNWSHSGDVALVALARQLPQLGVDVEINRPRSLALQLAQRFFSLREYQQLMDTHADVQPRRFLQLWTAKEAVLKAHGHGISYGLDRIAFTIHNGLIQPLHFDGDIGVASAWNLRIPDIGSDVVAHVAWRGSPRHLYCFRADDDLC